MIFLVLRHIYFVLVIVLIAKQSQAQITVGDTISGFEHVNWVNKDLTSTQKINPLPAVIDFWFTSCAPCIYTIPHLNKLATTYQSQKINFLALSFEDKNTVEQFIEKKKIIGQVGIDTDRKLIKELGVQQFPITYLIDEHGVIRWKGYPTALTSSMIDLLIEKEYHSSLKQPATEETKLLQESNELGEDTYPIEVTRNHYLKDASGWQSANDQIIIVNYTLSEILAKALNNNKNAFIINDSDKYDIEFTIPKHIPQHEIGKVFVSSLLYKLGLKLEPVNKTVEGYKMNIDNLGKFINNAIDTTKKYKNTSSATYENRWEAKGITLQQLVNKLEELFEIHIKDNTITQGFFEFNIPTTSFEDAQKFLSENYGIILTSQNIEVRFYKLSKSDRQTK